MRTWFLCIFILWCYVDKCFDSFLFSFFFFLLLNYVQKLFASSFSGSFCSATSLTSFNLHVNACPALSVSELCGVCVGVNNGVDGYFGGDEAGVLKIIVVVIFSKNPSNCFKDSALCSVSNGLIGGTPPNPSRTKSFTSISDSLLCKPLYFQADYIE